MELEKIQLQQEEDQKRDAVGFQMMEDGKSVSENRAEKWQRSEFTLQLQQEELEELTTKNRSDNSQNTPAEAGDMAGEIKMKKIAAQREREREK